MATKEEIEIPLGAKDSELCGWEYTIPEGMEATIVDNKIIVKKKESEDEKIRKAIHIYLDWLDGRNKDYHPKGIYTIRDMIAWLEKQGEQKPQRIVSAEAKEVMYDKPADKVEPKFKVGDWVVYDGFTYQITEVHEDGYSNDKQGFIPLNRQDKMRLWTIQDAKDGDVLCTKNKCCPFIYDKGRYNNGLAYYYAGIDVSGNLNIKSPHNMLAHFGRLDNIRPATQEQRDLLFQKMHEACYEWNAEKLELKKVEQELTEFENIVEKTADIAILNAYGVKELAKRLLSNAKKQLQEEFDKQLEKAYKNADKVQYKRGYRKAIEDAREWVAYVIDNDEEFIDSFNRTMEQKLKELS